MVRSVASASHHELMTTSPEAWIKASYQERSTYSLLTSAEDEALTTWLLTKVQCQPCINIQYRFEILLIIRYNHPSFSIRTSSWAKTFKSERSISHSTAIIQTPGRISTQNQSENGRSQRSSGSGNVWQLSQALLA